MRHKLLFCLVLIISFNCLNVFSVSAQFTDSEQKEEILESRQWIIERTKIKPPKPQRFEDALRSSSTTYKNPHVYPITIMNWGKGFSEGLAKVTVYGNAGFINTKGQLVIKANFKDAGYFSESLAPVEINNGKWGYINKAGEFVVKPKFDWAFSFKEGRALVQIGKKWGFIDNTGEFVIQPQFDLADGFSEGLALVSIYDKKYKIGFIDKNGNWSIEPNLSNPSHRFREGIAEVCRDIGYNNGVVVECFFIDKNGKKLFVTNTRHDTSAFEYSEGLITIYKDTKLYKYYNFVYGFMDKNGDIAIDYQFEDASNFSEGLAAVRKNDKVGYINMGAKMVIEPQFIQAGSFSEGLACVQVDSGSNSFILFDTYDEKNWELVLKDKWGFIDKSGRFVIKPQFDWAWDFQEGFALVAIGEKTGYIDKTGKVIWKPTK